MALFRFLFAPALLAVAVVAGHGAPPRRRPPPPPPAAAHAREPAVMTRGSAPALPAGGRDARPRGAAAPR